MATILIRFTHGLGDAVQLTAVLLHLRTLQPHWTVDLAVGPGRASLYHGLARYAYTIDRDEPDHKQYDRVFGLDWAECRCRYPDWPATKTCLSLIKDFSLTPIPQLCRYTVAVPSDVATPVLDYYDHIAPAMSHAGDRRVVLIHYQGNTSPARKDLTHEVAKALCDAVLSLGRVPVILDWDRRSPLPDNVTVHCPAPDHPLWRNLGTGDGATIAAMAEHAELCVGIDSGPGHIFGAVPTRSIVVWTGHHPIHYYDLAPNILHMVPTDHHRHCAGEPALTYFRSNYWHHVYRSLEQELPAVVRHLLTGYPLDQAIQEATVPNLTSRSYTADYYLQHRQAGLDYLGHGDWQREYGKWLMECLEWHGRTVLDVGCACGSVLRGLGHAGAVVQGVDVSEYMIGLGRAKWPDMKDLLHTCDAVNLHLYADASWDGIHCAQVAEHWRPHLVSYILEELARVTRPGGLLWLACDTLELYARQGRDPAREDPTHECIRSRDWWQERFRWGGWQNVTSEYKPRLDGHANSYTKRYDWDWWVLQRQE